MNAKTNTDVRSRSLGLTQVAILNVISTHPIKSYGTAISDEVSKMIGREIADAQIYVALQRLEFHGFVSSSVDHIPLPSKRTRGRPRKYYALTAKGRRALESAGKYVLSDKPFMQSASRGEHEGKLESPVPSPVVV